MDVSSWSPIGVGLVGLAATVIQRRRQRPAQREQIMADLEMWEKLPSPSASRDELLAHVDRRVRQLIKDEVEKRRDVSGMTIGAVMTGLFGWLGWWAWDSGGAWRWFEVPIVFLLIVGVVGFFTSLRRSVRDEKGNVVKSQPAPPVL